MSNRVTSFVGRDAELAALAALLRGGRPRLVTLVGPGGVGKTRLAREAVALPRDDGVAVVVVPLAAIPDVSLVVPAIARELGIRERAGAELFDDLVDVLKVRRTLLLIDNCEHLLPAGSAIAALLASVPTLAVLATSRAPLHLHGERVVEVTPLASDSSSASGEVFGPDVRLFIDRVREVSPGYAPDAEEAMRIAAICRRLDGLPLAIELAAARATSLPLTELLARLDEPEQTLAVLSVPANDPASRQNSLQATLAWSYDLLTPAEQTLFRRLAVLSGGFTVDGAESFNRVVEGLPADAESDAVIGLLDGLLDQSLIRPIADEAAGRRFGMLETVRAFALTAARRAGEGAIAQEALVAWAIDLAEQAQPHLLHRSTGGWFDRLEAEIGNLRAALAWLRAQGDADRGIYLTKLLIWFFSNRGFVAEGRVWLDDFLTKSADNLERRARALIGVADLANWQGESESALVRAHEALAILGDDGNPALRAAATSQVARAYEQGDELAAAVLAYRATIAAAAAAELAAEEAAARCGLARILHDLGERAEAVALIEDAVGRPRAIGSDGWLSFALDIEAFIRLAMGEADRARPLVAECLTLAVARGDRWRIGACWFLAGEVAHRDGELERAVSLLAAASALRDRLGVALVTLVQRRHDCWLGRLRQRLGSGRFTAAWTFGERRGEEETIALAWQTLARKPPSAPAPKLTRRDREVLTMLVQGLSDAEIAERLTLSLRSAETYVYRLRVKLGVETRTEAIAAAIDLGFVDPTIGPSRADEWS